jgi:phage tail protein X
MPKKYTSKLGDMWDSIAFEQMGSAKLTDKLISANVKHHNIYIFPAGIELIIPDVKIPPPGGMPPWKQVNIE